MTCRNKEKTPTPEPAINFIKQGVSRILKLLPNTMVAKHIYNCDTLIDLFSWQSPNQTQWQQHEQIFPTHIQYDAIFNIFTLNRTGGLTN